MPGTIVFSALLNKNASFDCAVCTAAIDGSPITERLPFVFLTMYICHRKQSECLNNAVYRWILDTQLLASSTVLARGL